MNTLNIIFFGSTTDSVIILEKLFRFQIVSVVTQPPRPTGRNQLLTETPVEAWAKAHDIPLLSFPTNKEKPWLYQDENAVIDSLSPFGADIIISASYGQMIPRDVITRARLGGLNVHPSLLPRWRGADPMPWVILSGDHQTGVTLVTLSEKFDEGKIIAQKKIPVPEDATPDSLRETLFTLGADLLGSELPKYLNGSIKGTPQDSSRATRARRLTRDDGYVPWELLKKAIAGEDAPKDALPEFFQEVLKHSSDTGDLTLTIERALRALSPWPGVWTNIRIRNKELGISETKRLKILSGHLKASNLVLDTVQLEGKNPVSWRQFITAYQIQLPS